ncbi:hypothetical protein GGF50DRAFT_129481 [Schizophyllum commune]
MIHHPEYNSTLILRSECLSDKGDDFPDGIPVLEGLSPTRCIHRKLLPRRPGRDGALEQYCTFYCSPEQHAPSVLVLTPLVSDGASLPYYHPARRGNLRLEIVPLPGTPTDVSSRLYRTGLALLETAHRFGWGALTQYKKRVHHDCLVPREPYQDLYLVMRERHRHLVDEWQESTDPLEHVFEDIGIATYLMLLWKYTYAEEEPSGSSTAREDELLDQEPWKQWPRPPGGFVDLGCGNGLLTHILVSEGYAGHGFDVRARTSCAPTSLPLTPPASDISSPATFSLLPPHAFLIGNHADELTPWIPIIATLHAASGYLSIPCLNLGGGGTVASGYSMYRVWLASLSLHYGWEVETEALRIPSTRNWEIVDVHVIRSRCGISPTILSKKEILQETQPSCDICFTKTNLPVRI